MVTSPYFLVDYFDTTSTEILDTIEKVERFVELGISSSYYTCPYQTPVNMNTNLCTYLPGTFPVHD